MFKAKLNPRKSCGLRSIESAVPIQKQSIFSWWNFPGRMQVSKACSLRIAITSRLRVPIGSIENASVLLFAQPRRLLPSLPLSQSLDPGEPKSTATVPELKTFGSVTMRAFPW